MDSKSIFLSQTFWGLLITLLAPLLAKAGITLPGDTAGLANDLAAGLGALVSVIGRMRATQPAHIIPSPSAGGQGGFCRIGILPLLSLLALVAACQVTPKTPGQSVYVATGVYLAALDVAVAYAGLPPCGGAAVPIVCAEPAVVADVRRADDVAHGALQAAQAVVRTPGAGLNAQTAVAAAVQAVQAFASITSTLRVK